MTTNAQLQFIFCGNLSSIGQNTQIAVSSLLCAFVMLSSRCADCRYWLVQTNAQLNAIQLPKLVSTGLLAIQVPILH
jgi:hypothetical protein